MNKERVIGLISLMLGIIATIGAMLIKVSESGISQGDPGPRVFPMVAGILLIICGIGLFIQKNEDETEFLSKEQWKRLLKLFLLFLAYALGLYLIGFVISTPVFLYFMMTMFAGEKKLSVLIKLIYCIAITAILYISFVSLFKANIPTGIIIKLLS